ncbi:parvulin-like peptidyl-prolyl cis-trans isomerase protein [Prosthecobacter fusiformis]|uniref:Parvulin-like peptidyl-prolyl cis-trans isomerase protein n=1 Tax=Prosthecobacter fusiformis TaxID=48464 RepID=A0A4R7RME3_9BACT|nr:peptidylprolyl isomerase [Prosthecobacter fusiformis]TDU66551.1 parvulin-like peptidyl-prolyl cis-trans isomerase protein [Prosthecobacter fusiformis]
MLEFFRRHRGAFLITVTVVIIISFSVWGGWKGRESPEGQPTDTAFTVYGRNYTIAEAQRLGRRMQMIYNLQMFELLGLSRLGSQDDKNNNIVINQIVLQKEMDRLGIHPSDAEAKEAMKKIPTFQENGAFSAERAYNVEQMLGANGFSSDDLLGIVKLSIGYNKLRDLVSKSYTASPLEAEKAYASEHQTLKVNTIAFNLEDYKKTAEVKDEEIQKYYDEQKETYKTAEKRSISYVYFELPKADETKPLEERQNAEKAVVDRVNKFNDASILPAAKFDAVVTELKEKAVTTELFTKEAAPEAIKAETDLLDSIFTLNPEVRPISDPVKGANGYYIFTVTKVEEPKQQELAEVKDKVKEVLVGQKAQEALTKATNEARTALADGLKAGKKIADIAKEKNLTLSPVTDITVAEPALDVPNGNLIARQAQDTPAGELTKAIDTETGSLLVYVSSKELRKRDDSAAQRENMSSSRADQERTRIFEAWFSRRRDESKPKMEITQA